ncbi:MAG: hypothetical protein KDC88_04150 [Ignavibacteriae bacterium]|nr:hypothetical protein [Ignavibacteriota bacterium]MCB9208081.1 hypothetical protein [Ignavibacteriales bacterium]MCB9258847.1 hypothetical protein [Ignavibacteriales bacterium]
MKQKITFLLFFLMLLSSVNKNAICQSSKKLIEITPQIVVKNFYWGEYNDNSVQDLEEYGNLYGGGFQSKFKFSQNLDLFIYAEAYFYNGTVDYNGFLQDVSGNFESYKSETVYEWFESTFNIGYDFNPSYYFSFSPELGFQFESWDRDIDNGGQYGYNEIYDMFLIDFGCTFTTRFSSNAKIFFKILGEYPLLIDEFINLAARGHEGPEEINLEPQPNIGLNAELGANTYGVYFSVIFDYLIFSKSFFDQGFHQPESDRTIVGIKLGYTF